MHLASGVVAAKLGYKQRFAGINLINPVTIEDRFRNGNISSNIYIYSI